MERAVERERIPGGPHASVIRRSTITPERSRSNAFTLQSELANVATQLFHAHHCSDGHCIPRRQASAPWRGITRQSDVHLKELC